VSDRDTNDHNIMQRAVAEEEVYEVISDAGLCKFTCRNL
jgi:hypothetical protein